MACRKVAKVTEVSSPIGEVFLKCCQEGVHEIYLNPKISDENFHPQQRLKNVEIKDTKVKEAHDKSTDICIKWLSHYFENPFKMDDVEIPKICPLGEDGFRPKVWERLLSTVKVGETVSYQELANRLNNPGAARAVGSAMKNNPVCLLVPCHRVVRKNGLGMYSGGTRQRVKEWLLQHEGVDLFQFGEVKN